MNTFNDINNVFLSPMEENKKSRFEGWSKKDIERYLHRQYLKMKGYDNFTDLEKGLYRCTGSCCYCGGLERYGYCREYDYPEWREGNIREHRNKEIWGLFSASEYRPRADTNYERDYDLLPFALGGIKKKRSKNKLSLKRFSRNPRYRRNKTY